MEQGTERIDRERERERIEEGGGAEIVEEEKEEEEEEKEEELKMNRSTLMNRLMPSLIGLC